MVSRRLCFPFFALLAFACPLGAEPIYERSPLRYWDRPVRDQISRWERESRYGRSSFDAKTETELVQQVLDELDVPVESQVLVFSKTSFQVDKIAPLQPRAIYFSDKHYVGWVPGGEVEITTVDPKVGFTFYRVALPGPGDLGPKIVRDKGCLFCHAGRDENPYPGLMVLSTPTSAKGTQLSHRGGVVDVDHTTPVEERWGGWYVTGQWEGPRHRGNLWLAESDELSDAIDAADTDLGPSAERLQEHVDLEPYLADTSDAVALLVLEHQALAHNRLLQAFGNTRLALYNDEAYMRGDAVTPETRAVFETETAQLLDAFLFKNEASLSAVSLGADSPFTAPFEARSESDEKGRSLRQLQLDDRLFEYRCSYMIHSEAFEQLPGPFREHVLTELEQILGQPAGTGDYPYLTNEERSAIREILTDTGVLAG